MQGIWNELEKISHSPNPADNLYFDTILIHTLEGMRDRALFKTDVAKKEIF